MDPGVKSSNKTALRWLFKRVGAATTWILLSVGLGLIGGVLLIFQARFLARIVHGAFMENLAIDVLQPYFYILVGIIILRVYAVSMPVPKSGRKSEWLFWSTSSLWVLPSRAGKVLAHWPALR
jgi:hypothetical protein